MPFGTSISCSHFQKISDALRHIVEKLERINNRVSNYLDDFLFLHYLHDMCNHLMRRFLAICDQIGFPVAMEKTEWASPIMVFLGILLNGKCHKLMVPEDKVNTALQLINRICSKKKATIKELQIVAGTLNFLHKAIVPGRAFTRRIYNKYEAKINEKKLKSHHHISLDLEFRNDCYVWKQFLMNQYSFCWPFIDLDEERTNMKLKINEKKLKSHHHISLDLVFQNDCYVWKQFLMNQDSLCQPFIDLDEEKIYVITIPYSPFHILIHMYSHNKIILIHHSRFHKLIRSNKI